MESTEGNPSGGAGQTCPSPLNIQGQQHVSWGTLLNNVPPDLLGGFEWFFKEILGWQVPGGLAARGSKAASLPPVPAWKVLVIRLVGSTLLTMMASGLAFSVVTHAADHNPDGTHKTIQVQGSNKEADDGGKSDIENVDDEPGSDDGNPATDKIIYRIGQFEYRAGFKDVWVQDVHYDLRGYTKARLCLKYFVIHKAVNEGSSRHFVEEIDPYVRKTGGFIDLAEIRLKDYFRDPSGQLARLRRVLIRSAGKNGKFYIQTGPV